jgi:hypothetical protein
MECNVGGAERWVRLGAGALCVAAGIASDLPKALRTILITAGTINLITGAVQYCPMNELVGRNSCLPSAPATSLNQ